MSDYNLRKNDTARVVNSSFYQKNNLKIGQHNRKNYSQKKNDESLNTSLFKPSYPGYFIVYIDD